MAAAGQGPGKLCAWEPAGFVHACQLVSREARRTHTQWRGGYQNHARLPSHTHASGWERIHDMSQTAALPACISLQLCLRARGWQPWTATSLWVDQRLNYTWLRNGPPASAAAASAAWRWRSAAASPASLAASSALRCCTARLALAS